jgi:phage FluMu gp28-like protein
MTQTIEQSQPRQSLIRFDRSQRALFEDSARIIAANFHRQKGKDFTAAAKAVNEACDGGQDWWIVGLTQAQADETFIKCKRVARAMKELLKRRFGSDEVSEESSTFVDYDREIDQAFECRAHALYLPNGARVTSLPGRNPDALAGRTGNQIWTEFGLYPNGGYDHWGVLFPIITRGGFKIVIISTPRGKNTKFYEVMLNADGLYSTHFCDIYKSVFEEGYQLYDARGNPFPQSTRAEQERAIATFRKMYNDEAKWGREYECQFTGDLSSLIPWAELEAASALPNPDGFAFRLVRDGATPPSELGRFLGALAGRRLEIGWDVARRGDLSAIAINKYVAHNQPRRLIGVIAMKNCTFEFQRAAIMAVMDSSHQAVGYGDATGLGMDSNETLAKKYPNRWTPFTFSATGKREVASAIRTGFNDQTQTIPPMDGEHKCIATDVYAVQKDDTGANLVLDEGKNELLPDSHCDIAYAIGLARLAGANNARLPLPPPRRHKPVGW